jgi:hypothetical protein
MKRIVLAVLALSAAAGAGYLAFSAASGSKPTDKPSLAEPGLARVGEPNVVHAGANILGAGRDVPPAPGGGGAGFLPPGWRLPATSTRIVAFPSVTGKVNPIAYLPDWNGPAGDGIGATDVESYEGISGIIHDTNGMFLVGVFLTGEAPSGTAPPRLDFTNMKTSGLISPRIAQTFLIGDGTGYRFRVPSGATRLFVGFADAYLYKGPPGWYGNNAGELTVTVELTGR